MTAALPGRLGPTLLALPAIAVILLFFIVPVALILAQSVLDPAPTMRFYVHLLTTPEYATVFFVSFKIALLTSVISMVASYPVAYLLVVARPTARAVMLTLILLPFWTNVLIRCYAWMLMLQTKGL